MIIKRRIVITFILAISLLFGMTTVSFAENTEITEETTATVEFTKNADVNVLKISSAPAIDFGEQNLPFGAATFVAEEITNGLEIKDHTGNNSGWSVAAKLGNFINDLREDSMPGAFITLTDGTATRQEDGHADGPSVERTIKLTSGAENSTHVATADVNKGMGTWLIGWNKDAVKLDVLDIPAPGTNSATIEWILTAAPVE